MAIRVTRPVTKYGHYYKTGTVIESPSGTELSYGRLYGWETVTVPEPAKKRTKPELVQVARERGLNPAGLSKAELIELLEE